VERWKKTPTGWLENVGGKLSHGEACAPCNSLEIGRTDHGRNASFSLRIQVEREVESRAVCES
jgi:hypothetical protein